MSAYTSSPERVDELIRESWQILQDGIKEHVTEDGRDVAAVCVLYSGGNDSTTLAHMFRNVADYALHANTTIGVEETRQFVRDTCERWGLPLIEERPPVDYRALVLDQGFPGPAMHWKMYQRLKERCLRQARKKLVKNPRRERVVYIAGRRRAESARRADIPASEREGSTVWISPLVNWRKEDLHMYREVCGDVPVNPVSERLGMSGECLCGAFAEPGEFDRIIAVDPVVAQQIVDLETEVAAAGRVTGPRCKWGWGAYKADPSAQRPKTGPMCSSCDARYAQPDPGVTVSPALQAVLDRRAARKMVQG